MNRTNSSAKVKTKLGYAERLERSKQPDATARARTGDEKHLGEARTKAERARENKKNLAEGTGARIGRTVRKRHIDTGKEKQ